MQPRTTRVQRLRTGKSANRRVATVCVRGDHLELRMRIPFSTEDLDTVKSIPGRSWDPDRKTWILPHSSRTLDMLARSFGSRIVLPAPTDHDDASNVEVHRTRGMVATSHASEAVAEDTIADMRQAIKARGYSQKTEIAYVGWVRRFLHFHAPEVEDPARLEARHAVAFLQHLASGERLSAKSRNQAASALGFMFREVFGRDEMADVPRAKARHRIPTVLTHREVLRVLRQLSGKYFLIVALLYSAGLRLAECLRMRVKDIDFELRQILIRDGKGRRDRYVPLARRSAALLRAQIERVNLLHQTDRNSNHGWAPLPAALHRKDPRAGYEPGWQHIFPASTITRDPATGRTGRRPLHPSAVQREVKHAIRESGVTKRASCHTFRHSFATEALRGGCDIRTLQHVMGHKDVRVTMVYLHVVEQTGHYIRSPLDRPDDPEDYEHDLAANPGTEVDNHWDLAAKRWEGTRL